MQINKNKKPEKILKLNNYAQKSHGEKEYTQVLPTNLTSSPSN